MLASRIERYLIQHPYVRTLTVNAFNPGRATVLADALAALQRQEAFRDLRYDVRLFVPDPNAPGVGESIDTLLAGGGTSAGEAFSIPTGSRIFPKLTVAVRATADFRTDPDRFRCHLSILFDVFPPEEMAAGRPLRAETTIPLHGLVQEFTTRFHDDAGGTWWRRQPRHGTPVPIAGGEEASILLGELPALISSATATVARSTPDSAARPIVRLELASAERALINEVHDASDWVFTIDRNMGIEFFDHGGRRDRPDYLIDYTPSTVPEHGHRLIISSRSLAELEAILRPVLDEYGLDTSERHAVVVLDQLRSLSGRLALKLVSGPTARAEALGMALARMFLEYQGALRNQIVVPLDAHVDLFRTVQSQAEEMGDQVTLHRTDLALFDLDLAKRTVSCNLVEVKCCAQRLGLSGYGQLKERITQQINQSERILQRHFDPQRTTPDRPDRLLKTRELATLLDFYLERGLRYRLIEREVGEEARALLDRLEEGYRLRFSRSGLVFDFDKPGTEPPEHEVDIEFHRIGVDLIHDLVNNAASVAAKRSSTDGGNDRNDRNDRGNGGTEDETTREATRETTSVSALVSSIPRLDGAAFLVEDRPRSTSDLDDAPLDDEPWTHKDAGVLRMEDAPESPASDGASDSMERESATADPPAPAPSGELPLVVDQADRVDGAAESEPVARQAPAKSAPGSRSAVDETVESEPLAPPARSRPEPSQGHITPSEGGESAGTQLSPTGRSADILPSPTGRGAGGEGPRSKTLQPVGRDPSFPHPKPLSQGERGFTFIEREMVPDSGVPEPSVESDPPARDTPQPLTGDGLEYDALLGVTGSSPQYGLLGEAIGRKIALDLNQTHTISLFGVQGGGKSYTVGSVVEMACMSVEGVNALPHPLAGVIFHYSSTLDYRPEFASMAAPNRSDAEVAALQARYGAAPRALSDLVILAPAAKVEERRAEYPGIEVLPIAFAAAELKASHWKFLMGAVGSQSMYIRQLALIMKKLRGKLTLAALRQGVQDSGLSDYLKELALLRLQFAEDYIDDAHRLTDILRPGRLVIVDLRDELIEKDEALGLFVVLLQMFAETTHQGRRFNKLVVFDEAHKYIDSPDLVAGLVEVVREMRHKGTSIMVASQDPPSVPTSLVELSTQIILHKFNSPAWLKHIQKANAALDALTPAKLASLGPGEAYVWSSKATDDAFVRGAVKVRCRPRVTRHGGGTKTAVVVPLAE